MNVKEAELLITGKISSIYEGSEAKKIASLALEYITGCEWQSLITGKNHLLDDSQMNLMNKVIERLSAHEPIQYIMNKAWFYGMELYVDKHVLIPRPETEELVDWIVKDVKASGLQVFEKKPGEADETTRLKILDVGTGSGCIALALKKSIPLAEVWGCDISDSALNVARRNGSELDIRVDFQSVDYLNPAQQKHLPSVDILVSNPPYVPEKDKESMQPNVLQYEPHTALFVDDNDPLVFYRALLAYCVHRLHPGGRLYMEIHEDLGNEVATLFSENHYSVTVRKDMQGKERMVKVERMQGS